MADLNELPKFDAGTYQKPLAALAEVMALKLSREASKLLNPDYAGIDLHILLRTAMRAYDLLHYINADVRRETDTDWKIAYSIETLPLIRNMIDCLYNITAILQNPSQNVPLYRKSGFRNAFRALTADEERYGGEEQWDNWILKTRSNFELHMRASRFTLDEVMASQEWPTLGRYIATQQPGGTLTAHQQSLRTFTYGYWKQYSAIAHGAFEGILLVGPFFILDSYPIDQRETLEQSHIGVLSEHMFRAAAVLLCIVTEVQAHFRFEGASINQRIHAMWTVLLPLFDAKELYHERYRQLIIDRGIEDR